MTHPPEWLQVVAWLTIACGIGSAVLVLWDIRGRGHRQQMRVMEWVWPITCLYTGPIGLWGYRRLGLQRDGRPRWASTALGVSHCGAGCTLGDIIAEWLVFAFGLTLAGEAVYPEMIGDYVLAVLLGLAFQYFAIAPMRDLGVRDGIIAAAKADILSLTAFEIGLFGWMLLQAFVLFPAPDRLHPDDPVFWLGMQIGMCLGFATAWPVNVLLIKRGIKEPM